MRLGSKVKNKKVSVYISETAGSSDFVKKFKNAQRSKIRRIGIKKVEKVQDLRIFKKFWAFSGLTGTAWE